MYNPYLMKPEDELQPVSKEIHNNPFDFLKRVTKLNHDDLILLLLLLLILQEEKREEKWPLLAALIYCLL